MNVRNQEHQHQQEQAQQLAKHGWEAEQGTAWAGWHVVGRYRTQSGRVGAEIRVSAKTGRFSYCGAWGAGSGHDKAGMVRYPAVDMVEEMTTLMTASRGYEANVRAFNFLRGMLQRAIEIGGK